MKHLQQHQQILSTPGTYSTTGETEQKQNDQNEIDGEEEATVARFILHRDFPSLQSENSELKRDKDRYLMKRK